MIWTRRLSVNLFKVFFSLDNTGKGIIFDGYGYFADGVHKHIQTLRKRMA